MNIDRDLEHFKRYREIPNGSLIIYLYKTNAVTFVASSKLVDKKGPDGPVPTWEHTAMGDYLNGVNGVILSRQVDGTWCDRPESIKFLQSYLEKLGK